MVEKDARSSEGVKLVVVDETQAVWDHIMCFQICPLEAAAWLSSSRWLHRRRRA